MAELKNNPPKYNWKFDAHHPSAQSYHLWESIWNRFHNSEMAPSKNSSSMSCRDISISLGVHLSRLADFHSIVDALSCFENNSRLFIAALFIDTLSLSSNFFPLTLSFPMFPFDPAGNITIQGDQKGALGRNGSIPCSILSWFVGNFEVITCFVSFLSFLQKKPS